MTKPGKLRIIAGKWRNTKIPVENVAALRPTPDRIRETLFNWLQVQILEARCLDLFAGSAALSFEAASREAKLVDCVEKDPRLIANIQSLSKQLQAEKVIQVHCADSMQWLEKCTSKYDIIFLDPPFKQKIIPPILQTIKDKALLNTNARVYVEFEKGFDLIAELQADWEVLKTARAGEVQAYLLALNIE